MKTRLVFAVSLLIGLMASQLYLSIAFWEIKSMLMLSLACAGIAVLVLWWQVISYFTAGIRSLQRTIHQAATEGTISHLPRDKRQDEFAHLAHSIKVMLNSLELTRQENNRLHQAALQMQEEKIALLKQHLSQVVKAQEAERKRVSRELHDQTGQALLAIQFGLGRMEKYLNSADAKREIAELKSLTYSIMQDLKNLALDLRPSMLDELGLIPTVRQYVKEFTKRTGIAVKLDLAIPEQGLLAAGAQPDLDTSIFRIIQEGLTNVAKHAAASQVRIELVETGAELHLTIADNGSGFDVEQALSKQDKECIGLFGMQERVYLWHGRLEIKSQPGAGTSLLITIPKTNPLQTAAVDFSSS